MAAFVQSLVARALRPTAHLGQVCSLAGRCHKSGVAGGRAIPSASPRHVFRIDHSSLIEEETLSNYRPEKYYPVRLGEIFNDRYEVLTKLGYGTASTVWLCRDLMKDPEFVALKIHISGSQVQREVFMYERIQSIKTEHTGQEYIRKLLGKFDIRGPHGTHACLVHEPLGLPLGQLRKLLGGRTLNATLVRELFRYVIHVFKFLHLEAKVIHTDLQPNNIFLSAENEDIFRRFINCKDETQRRVLPDRTIYMSSPIDLTSGEPIVADFSEARLDSADNTDDIMPDVYRAPEVILGLPWSFPVDTWSIAMVIWDLLEGSTLFTAKDEEGLYSERRHLAEIVAVMGPPPMDMVQKSRKSSLFWDADGKWICDVPIPVKSIEDVKHCKDGEEREFFLSFLRDILQWRPEERISMVDMGFDRWLLHDLVKAGQLSPTLWQEVEVGGATGPDTSK